MHLKWHTINLIACDLVHGKQLFFFLFLSEYMTLRIKRKTKWNSPTYSSLTSSFLGHTFLHICSQVLILFFSYLSLSFISCRKILPSALDHNESSTSFHFSSHHQVWAIPSDCSHPTVLPPLLMLPSSPPFTEQVTSHHTPSFLNEWTNEWMMNHRRRSTNSNNNVLICIKPLFMSSNQHFAEERWKLLLLFHFRISKTVVRE